jgi:unconventional SNARE in the endoplasmic reticulum protein 1
LEIKTQINYVEPPEITRKLKSRNTDVDEGILKEIKQLNNAKYTAALRKDLFDGDDSSGLRKRGANESSENMEKYYSNIQEKLGEEMLSLTRNLKEQTLTASKILKKDTEVVLKSSKLANNNQGSLEKESKKLDGHNRRGKKLKFIIKFIKCFIDV